MCPIFSNETTRKYWPFYNRSTNWLMSSCMSSVAELTFGIWSGSLHFLCHDSVTTRHVSHVICLMSALRHTSHTCHTCRQSCSMDDCLITISSAAETHSDAWKVTFTWSVKGLEASLWTCMCHWEKISKLPEGDDGVFTFYMCVTTNMFLITLWGYSMLQTAGQGGQLL